MTSIGAMTYDAYERIAYSYMDYRALYGLGPIDDVYCSVPPDRWLDCLCGLQGPRCELKKNSS